MSGCGAGSTAKSDPPPDASIGISVAVSPATAVVEAGAANTQLSASVTETSNQSVTWAVNGTPGGSPTLGVISSTGAYTPPTAVADTTDFKITATAQADTTKSASATVTVFATPRIGVRTVMGAGEFYDKMTGARFVPRGNNYVRLQKERLAYPVSALTEWHTTLSVGLYDSARVEQAFKDMEALGYNVVKVWMDCCGATTGLGNGSGDGLNPAYLANLADFIKRAKAYHIYVIITLDDLPKVGGYQQMIDPACLGAWPGCGNLEYTTTGGINADKKFWQDLIRGLVAQKAPMDGIFAYQLREEYTYPPDWQQESWAPPLPLLPTSGTFTAANGKTYNMADPAQVDQLKNDSLIYWTDKTRAAIQDLAPSALVGVGFVTGLNPYVPDFGVIAASTADFIDGHTGPGECCTLQQDMSGWGKPAGKSAKPVMVGETAARVAPFPVEADAAAALKQWQIDSCQQYGMTGWLLWSWDSSEQSTLGFDHWYATRGTGLVGQTMSPLSRPDACSP
ncbi:MAG: hypothetical protein ACR2IF_10560 [Terriglobales bacterium]